MQFKVPGTKYESRGEEGVGRFFPQLDVHSQARIYKWPVAPGTANRAMSQQVAHAMPFI